jgi:hypothetical protein
VFCTKVGTTHPDEMYIVGATWTARLGRGGERRRLGHGARDGAGARLQQPDVQTERTIRFALWNNEETDRRRARLRRAAQALQGKEDPAGSASIPSRSGSA